MSSRTNPDSRPLPPGWVTQFNSDYGTWFYVNTKAPGGAKSQWTHPADDAPAEADYMPPSGPPPGKGGEKASYGNEAPPYTPSAQQGYAPSPQPGYAPSPVQSQPKKGGILGKIQSKLAGGGSHGYPQQHPQQGFGGYPQQQGFGQPMYGQQPMYGGNPMMGGGMMGGRRPGMGAGQGALLGAGGGLMAGMMMGNMMADNQHDAYMEGYHDGDMSDNMGGGDFGGGDFGGGDFGGGDF